MKPYVEPKMRRKMGDMPPAPTDEGNMGGGETPAEEAPNNDGNDSKPTAFLPKEMGAGKQWKPGDEIVLKVDAVDPETGELQVSYAPESPDEPASEEPTDTMSAMDKTMPEDGGGY